MSLKFKMDNWVSILKYDPLNRLLSSDDSQLTYFVRTNLLEEKVTFVIKHYEIDRIKKNQVSDGSWIFKSSSKIKYPAINHNLTETFKSLRILVGKYGLDRSDQSVSKAADYIFNCQTEEGDIRGILGNQYIPYYNGLLLEYMVKAGYGSDKRIKKCFRWLLENRQNDGGWVIPLQTVKVNKCNNYIYASKPIKADESLPSSHLATGMVLRAFASHPDYRSSAEVRKAGVLLKSRFFRPDKYNDRKAGEYWTKFQYPFWWTTLLSALDTLYHLGFAIPDLNINSGIEWFIYNQDSSGLWRTKYEKGNPDKVDLNDLWIGYGICKVFKQFFIN